MKISKLIKECAENDDHIHGAMNHVYDRCVSIAEDHEAEYGWQPIETTPKDGRTLVMRLEPAGSPVTAYFENGEWIATWSNHIINPTEWYKFDEEEK